MPKNDPPKHTQFKPGASGNPLGGKLHNKAHKALKNLTEKEMIEIGSLVLKGSIEDLRKITKDEKASGLKCMIAGVAIKVISKGDAHGMDLLLNRLIGKAKQKIEISGELNGNLNFSKMTPKELDEKINSLVNKAKKKK